MDNQNTSHKEKFEVLNRLLDQDYVLVHVATGHSGTEIPEHLKKDPVVVLKLSRWFRGTMEVGDSMVTADLLFNGAYFSCRLPFDSIWGVTSAKGEVLLWPVNMPPEAQKFFSAAGATGPVEKPMEVKAEESVGKKHPEADAAETTAVDSGDKAASQGATLKRISHLRRVK